MQRTLPWPLDGLVGAWRVHGDHVIAIGLLVVALVVVGALLVSWRRGRVDRWVSTVTGLAVLALSAEGMWVVVRERLGLPAVLAVAVAGVSEAALTQSALQATRHYERTTVRDSSGRVVRPGTPGKHGRAVWIIAVGAGVIVALNSRSAVEFLLRLALPSAAAMLWWNALTAEGTVQVARSSWRWTPHRLLLWLGAIEPGDRDVETISRDRVIAAMTVAADRYHSGGRLVRWWCGGRLRRLARGADDDLVAEVARRVERVWRITELTDPVRRAELVGSGLSGDRERVEWREPATRGRETSVSAVTAPRVELNRVEGAAPTGVEPSGSRSAPAGDVVGRPVSPGQRSGSTVRGRVFATLDEMAPTEGWATRDVAREVAMRVPGCGEETAARYYRRWRQEMSESRRPLGLAPQLRMVAHEGGAQ